MIVRLNSGNFGIFYRSEFYLILSSRKRSVLKIVQNDTNIRHQLLNFRIKNQLLKIKFFSPEVSRVFSKDPLMNSEHFDTVMVSAEKPAKNGFYGGLKLRGLSWNQMNAPYFIYEIDQRKKLNTLGDFENQTPTHMDATHAFSKILQIFKIEFPGNWPIIFICWESEWLTDSFPVFLK